MLVSYQNSIAIQKSNRVGRIAALVIFSAVNIVSRQASAQSVDDGPPRKAADESAVGSGAHTGVKSGRQGPLAPLADRLAAEGLTFTAVSLDFFTANPSVGLVPGQTENSLYNILGADLDLSKRGLSGSSLHYQTTIFALDTNYRFLAQTGDSLVGYQGTYNKQPVLSVATFEQKAFNDRLDFEIGRTHPNRYYAAPNCQSLDSCFQDILYYNAGFTSPVYSVWGANLTYHVTPSLYAEAGVFSTNNGARIGYDLGREHNTGVLGIAEIGRKTGFESDVYPSTFSLTGFFNTASHSDLNAQSAVDGEAFQHEGTSGVVVQAQKIVWRADGGLDNDPAPTAIALYGSAGTGLDSTTPILADVYVGATLQSPFAGRPADRFGVKFNWERLNANYANYLGAANLVSGGSGAPYNVDHYVFEANAHIQLPEGFAFEPVVQYVIHPNSFYNPLTPARAKDGVFTIGTLVIPLGTLLGLTKS
jgi:porin